MGLFSSKQKEFSIEDFNSPVLKKVMEFHSKKGRLAADFEKNQGKVKVLTAKLEQDQEKYAESYSDEDLKELIATESELTALKNVVKAQQGILAKGNPKEYVLSDDEKQSLKETFAPYRKNRDDLVQKLHSQLAEVEKTLDELEVEQEKTYEFWAKLYGPILAASQENWMIGNSLNKQTETVVAQNKLNQLASHKGLTVHLHHI